MMKINVMFGKGPRLIWWNILPTVPCGIKLLLFEEYNSYYLPTNVLNFKQSIES